MSFLGWVRYLLVGSTVVAALVFVVVVTVFVIHAAVSSLF